MEKRKERMNTQLAFFSMNTESNYNVKLFSLTEIQYVQNTLYMTR